jgi:hypothetical protein
MMLALNSFCAGAKLNPMKIILAFMIFALAFSGYSAASHAMSLENCSSQSQAHDDNCAPEVQNSPDHAQKHDQSSKGFCLDCAHCCAASVMMPSTASWEPTPVLSALDSVVTQFQPENRLISLLRPPRHSA